MTARGFDKISLRIPEKWDANWYREHFRDVLSKGDARNVIPVGLTVTGNTNEPATFQASMTYDWGDLTGTPTTLAGYGITDAQPLDSDLTAIAALSTTSYGRGFLTRADASAARTYIGAVIGTDVQAYSANLAAYAGGDTPSAFTLGIVDSVDAAAWRTAIGASAVTPAALTKVDDTNVTLTLGGTPATSLLQATSITVGWTGTLAATRGGTGTGTYATGDILYASATNTLSKLAAGTNGYVLTLAAGVPTWAAASGGGGTDGTWTGTATNVSNTGSFTVRQGRYTRIGNTVTCSGVVELNVSAGAFSFRLSPPVASSFSNYWEAAGAATYNDGAAMLPVEVVGRAATDDLLFSGFIGSGSTGVVSFTATYTVI